MCMESLNITIMNGIRVPLLGRKPDLNPLSDLSQGVVKLDCVRVWFFCKNKKMMVSLSLTPDRDGGVYASEDPPTMTCEHVSSHHRHMIKLLLTVCVAMGAFGHPVDVGIATDVTVIRDGAALVLMLMLMLMLIDEVIATAVGVAIAVVVDQACHVIEDIIEDIMEEDMDMDMDIHIEDDIEDIMELAIWDDIGGDAM